MGVYVFKNLSKGKIDESMERLLKVLVRNKPRITRARKNNCCYLVYKPK